MKLCVSKKIFNPHFFSLLEDNEHDIILLLGSGGSGKSYFSYQRAVYRCLIDKQKYLILRKSAVDMERSCWTDIMAQLERWQIKDKVKINKTLKMIEYPNGSQMLFMGLDDQQKIKSIPDITQIVVEEATEITFDDYSQIKQRLRGRGKLRNQIVLMCNPVSKANWVYKYFFENGNQEPNCIINRSTYKDNPFLNQTTIDALESYKETNPYFYSVYCLGEWGTLSRLVYNNWHIQDLDIADLRKKKYDLLVGLDFGFTADPTALIVSLLDQENSKIYIINEFFEKGLTNPEIFQQIEKMGLAKSVIVADSAENKSIEEIKRLGARRIRACAKGQGSVNQGIQQLQQYEILVDSSCVNIIEELQNYCYKKDKSTGEYLNDPVDAWNHGLDALRYSLQCVELKQQLKTIPKGVLGL